MDEDYYKILGAKRSASQAEIQKAYREMARKYHPDLADDKDAAKERFQQIQQAYDVLNDTEKREMYDRYGASFEQMAGGSHARGRQGPGGASFQYDDVDFSQLFGQGGPGRGGPGGSPFEQIFRQFQGGGGPRPQRPEPRRQRGADLQHKLTVPFPTAVQGGEARVSVRRPNGKVESISVKIPAGIEDGKKIRLRGQGEPSPSGGPAGDILITVHVAPHPYFSRRGNDLEVQVPVTLAEAARGGKVEIPTPKGTISLTIPAGTSSGKRLRLKGQGIESQSGQAGDLFAVISIQLPDKLDKEALRLIQDFDQKTPFDPRADLSW